MATAHMPEEFFEAVAPHLPPEQPVGPKGGRPRVGHRTALRVIWFVLTAGTRWEDVPEELGCSGRTAHRRLRAWTGLGVRDGEALGQQGKHGLNSRRTHGGQGLGPAAVITEAGSMDRLEPLGKALILKPRTAYPTRTREFVG